MSKVLVIGYGNTLRGDDAAGIHAAERIAKRHPEIECLCVHQLVPELAEQIAECDLVFFVDAQEECARPEARLITPDTEIHQPRTHYISPNSLLALSQQLYQRTPSKTYVVGIPASKFEFSEKLSDQTEIAMQESVDLVDRIIREEQPGTKTDSTVMP